MMYAIVEDAGKQYKVSPGDIIKLDKPSYEKGVDVIFDKVLMVRKEGYSIYGSPYVNDAKVIATVMDSGKSKKIIVYKQKTRKGYRRLRGHRQPFTRLKIKEILLGGQYGT